MTLIHRALDRVAATTKSKGLFDLLREVRGLVKGHTSCILAKQRRSLPQL